MRCRSAATLLLPRVWTNPGVCVLTIVVDTACTLPSKSPMQAPTPAATPRGPHRSPHISPMPSTRPSLYVGDGKKSPWGDPKAYQASFAATLSPPLSACVQVRPPAHAVVWVPGPGAPVWHLRGRLPRPHGQQQRSDGLPGPIFSKLVLEPGERTAQPNLSGRRFCIEPFGRVSFA